MSPLRIASATRLVLVASVAAMILFVTSLPTDAATNSVSVNGFTVTVNADHLAPTSGDPYHTAGAGSMNIAFAGNVWGSVASNGTYSTDTYWDFVGLLWYDSGTIVDAKGTTGFPPAPVIVPGGMTTTVNWPPSGVTSLSANPSIAVGGHTANTDLTATCQNFTGGGLPLYVKHSVNFSVVNP